MPTRAPLSNALFRMRQKAFLTAQSGRKVGSLGAKSGPQIPRNASKSCQNGSKIGIFDVKSEKNIKNGFMRKIL